MIEILFLLSALISVFSLSAITVYLFAKGFPAIWEIGIMNFIFGMEWNPTADNPSYGIFPMIYASAAGTVGAVFLSVPVGLSAAVLLAAVAPPSLANFLRPYEDTTNAELYLVLRKNALEQGMCAYEELFPGEETVS